MKSNLIALFCIMFMMTMLLTGCGQHSNSSVPVAGSNQEAKEGSLIMDHATSEADLQTANNSQSETKKKKPTDGKTPSETKKLKIVTTIFPEYDWVRQIMGEQAEQAELTLLLKNGTDMHSFQPTVKDIAQVADCDMFVYAGGESDQWAMDALAEATNQSIYAINLMEVLGSQVKQEELKEGMEQEADEAETGEIEYDEHVWLSLRNTILFCHKIADALIELDPEHAEVYDNNCLDYEKKLTKLDKEFEKTVKQSSNKTLLFGDRFPFRYFVDDYGLDYYAAFAGCSAETEASFKTVIFLARKVDELGLKAVLTIENDDQRLAKTIRDNTKKKNQKLLVFNSLQSTTEEELKKGISYLSVMKSNLAVLKQAL